GVVPVRLLDVFAEGELDRRGCGFDHQVVGAATPAQLDHRSLAADRVGGAVEQLHRGGPAGESTPDADVVRIEDVGDAYLGGDRVAAFVDAAIDRQVGVLIDQPGGQVQARAVDDADPGRGGEPGADSGDAAAADQQIGVIEAAG